MGEVVVSDTCMVWVCSVEVIGIWEDDELQSGYCFGGVAVLVVYCNSLS